jgi:deoxyribodipyrimidine photo-lyase
MSDAPTLVWFRQDLRLSDNPALAAAVDRGSPVIPVFIWAPDEEGAWRPGAASQWWLRRSLAALNADLEKRGSRLLIRRGPAGKTLNDLLAESRASTVFWNRRYEPAAVARDDDLKARLRERGIAAESFHGNLLFEPSTIRNGSGQPFRVFTAFWRACLTKPVPPPSKNAPRKLRAPENWPHSMELVELGLEPSVDWAAGLRETWRPGESGAESQLKRFLKRPIQEYPVGRDKPAVVGTSRLSPHLHFGEISPGQVWRAVLGRMNDGTLGSRAACEAYLRQIGWREFAHQLLYHHPESPEQALRPEFAAFPWRTDPRALRAWTQGKTGYPLVDAGMRELWHTGWMHNRVRMVVASFLVKHLLIGWQEGAAWFWDTLVDADLASNTLGWQWVAGCGADAAPYFRIFNPVLQGERFDPAGKYVRRWVPELSGVPDDWIHKPWSAPASILARAGVKIGRTYPSPIVDHAAARERALAAAARNSTRSMPTATGSVLLVGHAKREFAIKGDRKV